MDIYVTKDERLVRALVFKGVYPLGYEQIYDPLWLCHEKYPITVAYGIHYGKFPKGKFVVPHMSPGMAFAIGALKGVLPHPDFPTKGNKENTECTCEEVLRDDLTYILPALASVEEFQKGNLSEKDFWDLLFSVEGKILWLWFEYALNFRESHGEKDAGVRSWMHLTTLPKSFQEVLGNYFQEEARKLYLEKMLPA